MAIIELIGGPMDGDRHKLHEGQAIPKMIGIPCERGVHWYRLDYERLVATFFKTVREH